MRIALALALALVACKRPDAKQRTHTVSGAGDSWGGEGARDAGVDAAIAAITGSLVGDSIAEDWVVLLPEAPSAKMIDRLEQEVRRRGYILDGDAPQPWAAVSVSSREDTIGSLNLFGPDGEALAAASTKGAIAISGGGPPGQLDDVHATLLALVRQAATAGHGWAVDLQSLHAYAAGSLSDDEPVRDAVTMTTFYVDPEPDGQGLSAVVTGGMHRYGLPELRVEHVPNGMVDQVGEVLGVSCQALLDRGELAAGNVLEVDVATQAHAAEFQTWLRQHEGSGRITWRATLGDDDDQRLLVLEPIGPGVGTARLGIAIDAFYGVVGWGVVDFDLDTPAAQAATEQAQDGLVALRAAFARGVPAGESLQVLAPFPTHAGDQYWLWIEVQRAKGDRWLHGTIIDSPPANVDAVLGDQVDVLIADVIDYKHERADGTTVGPLQPFNADE